MKNLAILVSALLLFGCGSSTTVNPDYEETGGTGFAGSTAETGGTGSVSTGGTGNTTETGGTTATGGDGTGGSDDPFAIFSYQTCVF